jgi:hypothetical protein
LTTTPLETSQSNVIFGLFGRFFITCEVFGVF